jgi:AI-2 transport protein TqsA
MINSDRAIRFLVIAASLVIIAWGIHQAQAVLALFLVSVFLAVIGTPQVLWLQRKRFPSTVAVLVVIAEMIVIVLMVGVLVGTSINSFSDTLPFYQARLQQQVLELKPLLANEHIVAIDKVMLEYLNPGPVMGLAVGLLKGMSSAFSNAVLILLTVSFILLEASSFPIKLRAALGVPLARFPQFAKFAGDITRYMVIQTVISLTVGVLTGIWLFILGVDFAILFGLLAFLLNYVPNVGAVIALIPIVILTFIQFGMGRTALMAAGYVVVTFILGNVVQPRLMGQKLGLSTLVVFLSLLFWGSLLGPIGMVLCVPFTMALKFALERSDDTRWIATLLGREPSITSIPPVSEKKVNSES